MPRKTPKIKTPTPEQLATLHEYAAWAGENWKIKLRLDWLRAGSQFPGEYAYLQQVRNTFGLKWLDAFELDREATPC